MGVIAYVSKQRNVHVQKLLRRYPDFVRRLSGFFSSLARLTISLNVVPRSLELTTLISA